MHLCLRIGETTVSFTWRPLVRALIGYTGFVGSNLINQISFDDLYNSSNIYDLRGRSFDQIICAGVSAIKWQANADPSGDWTGIERLLQALRSVKCRELVLISTIDVYPAPRLLDETAHLSGVSNHAYGTHRLALELICKELFETVRIVRLPALFGTGLKKNIVFDLINRNCLHAINPQSSFQWYDVRRLSADIETMCNEDLNLVNLVTEPVVTADLIKARFSGLADAGFIGTAVGASIHYDLRSRYAELFGGSAGSQYVESSSSVLNRLCSFVDEQSAVT